MLSTQNRLRDPELFKKAFRLGNRAGNAKLVVHAVTGEVSETERLVGFVVPKKVFKRAVSRNRVKRQLRHLMRERVNDLPPSTVLVVRVLAGAREADYAELEKSLDKALAKVFRRSGQ
ncbi:MAG: ribonuclease P protein component [Actinomycetaceae bacterium]|nr:ribonuclease P protein component [Actinomycetaceae bacterium]